MVAKSRACQINDKTKKNEVISNNDSESNSIWKSILNHINSNKFNCAYEAVLNSGIYFYNQMTIFIS